MRKLILEEWLSLDGFAADSNGNLDFFPSSEADKTSDAVQLKFLDSIDTILLGRKTYQLFVDFWPTATTDTEIIADRLNELPKVVFSNSIRDAPWGKWPAARVVSGDATAEIRHLRSLPGKNMVLWGSLTLAHQLIAHDLVDEYRLHVCPAIIGGGRRLFPGHNERARLERIAVRTYDTGVVFVHYVRQQRAS